MMLMNDALKNPTALLDLSFRNYVNRRQNRLQSHWVCGAPDYSFSLDRKLHQKLNALGPFRQIVKSMVSALQNYNEQLLNIEAVAVGPNQYPQIYRMGEECAKILGIGIPRIYVKFDVVPNGWTMAVDDREPYVVLTSALVNILSERELMSVIGHECGHIHSLHGIYNTIVQWMTNAALIGIASTLKLSLETINLLMIPFKMILMAWSRSAEVTCDRAGLICCGDLQAACSVQAKLQVGSKGMLGSVDIDQFLKQLEAVRSTPVSLVELSKSHPIAARRIAALQLFSQCETLYCWHPEMRGEMQPRGIANIDKDCEEIVGVLKSLRMKGFK